MNASNGPGGLAVLVAAGVIVSYTDGRQRRIPNWLVASLAALGLAARIADGSPAAGLAGLVTGFCALLPAYLVGWVGAGDVKLLAAQGLWLGWEGALDAALLGTTMAAVWAGHTLLRRGRAAWLWQGPYLLLVAWLGRHGREAMRTIALSDPVPTVPLGIFLSIGAVVVASWG